MEQISAPWVPNNIGRRGERKGKTVPPLPFLQPRTPPTSACMIGTGICSVVKPCQRNNDDDGGQPHCYPQLGESDRWMYDPPIKLWKRHLHHIPPFLLITDNVSQKKKMHRTKENRISEKNKRSIKIHGFGFQIPATGILVPWVQSRASRKPWFVDRNLRSRKTRRLRC
ncbi:hypothetical protein BJX68DRAFT_152223 [Aspergillus pseudodeflectus]|uniref:Uncharacterized protein n=1 Tax=Aspergillus pseudodeflectus TaxID=176178 RepID=A0ABR4JVG4_9EURO